MSGISALRGFSLPPTAQPARSAEPVAPRAPKAPTAQTAARRAPQASAVDQLLQPITSSQATSDKLVIDLASGHEVNIHNTMVELEQADIALRYTVQLRNRALSAYEELMRIQM